MLLFGHGASCGACRLSWFVGVTVWWLVCLIVVGVYGFLAMRCCFVYLVACGVLLVLSLMVYVVCSPFAFVFTVFAPVLLIRVGGLRC